MLNYITVASLNRLDLQYGKMVTELSSGALIYMSNPFTRGQED